MTAPRFYGFPQPQTGTGNWVRATSPTLTTPILGVAAATSLALGGVSTFLTSPTAASLQLGAANVDLNSAIVAQVLRTQGALTGGTTNQAGKDFTLIVSPGKGTGDGGAFIVQTAIAGSSGTTPNTPVDAIKASGTGVITLTSRSGSSTAILTLDRANAPFSFTSSVTGISGIVGFTAAGMTASSVVQTFAAFTPVINQTSTAGYSILLVNPSHSATGSGAKRLIAAQVDNVDKFTVDSTGLVTAGGGVTVSSTKALILGNAATTGLVAGVLAATTNASIVISDSSGQAYRIPCII